MKRFTLALAVAVAAVVAAAPATANVPKGAGLELLTDRMKTFKTNAEFLAEIGKTTS